MLSAKFAYSSIRSKTNLLGRRLGSTLAFIESSNGSITPATLSTLNAAKQIGNPIVAIALGSNAVKVSEELNKVDGLLSVIINKDERFDHNLPERITPLIVKLINDPSKDITHFIAPSSSVGKNIIPRIGALIDSQPISDAIKVENSNTFKRPIYAGNAIVTVKSNDSKILITARPSAFEQLNTSGSNSYPVEEISSESLNSDIPINWDSENLTKSERPELSSAKIVVSGGRGLKNKENFRDLIYPLADSLNAGIGATRAAVDSGFVDNSLQVGQTGKVIAPDLYLGVGISGAIQHLAGMKDSKCIVAINKDEDAPIFNVADIGLVGDLFEIVPELTEKIKKQ